MSGYSFTYRSEIFDLDKAYDAELLIKASRAEFSFLIISKGVLLAWKDRTAISEISNDHELATVLAANFKQVTIGLLPDALTLVPSQLFAVERVGDFARFLDVMPDDKVFAAKLDADNQLIYKTDHTFINFLVSKFNLAPTIPADRGWIHAIAKSEPVNYAIYMDVTEGQISLLNFNGGDIRFYNCFKTEDINDIIYYTLLVAQRLDIQPDYASLVISGNLAVSDMDKLKEFVRVVKTNDLKVLDIPAGVSSHQILSLAALA